MLKWIKQNRVPVIFITVFLIIALVVGIQAGLGYLNSERQAFVDKVAPGAIAGYEKYNILPSITIAQAILESGWGSSHIENNLFGMKPGSSWKGKVTYRNTKEYYNGKWITIKAKFRAYNNFSESIEDHARLLGTLNRYRNVLGQDDYKVAAMEIWKGGYATDPKYPQKLIKIIEQNELYKYDQQAFQIVAEKERKAEEARKAKEIKYKYVRDVPDGKWYTKSINRLYEQGIVKGSNVNGEILIRPNDKMTRAEVFTLIDRILNEGDE